MEFNHVSVLFDETIESLNIKENGLYVDCTCGGAGHSKAVLEKIPQGHLIAIDRDPDAIKVISERIGSDNRVEIVHNTFDNIKEILKSQLLYLTLSNGSSIMTESNIGKESQ